MSLRPDNRPFVQDMPPPGGFKKIDFTRKLPPRGPNGIQLWAGATLAIMYGFYQIGQSNQAKVLDKLHERRLRYTIAPYLQAESDREYVQREIEILEKEKEIMKNVEGWKVGQNPYNSGKWMPRFIADFSRNAK